MPVIDLITLRAKTQELLQHRFDDIGVETDVYVSTKSKVNMW